MTSTTLLSGTVDEKTGHELEFLRGSASGRCREEDLESVFLEDSNGWMSPTMQWSKADSVALSQMDEYARLRSVSATSSTHTLRDKHQISAEQFLCLGIWEGLLLCNLLWNRMWCSYGIPADCHVHHRVTIFEDIKELFTLGFILGIMTALHIPNRFLYCFGFRQNKWRASSFMALFFGVGPAFGALGMLPYLTAFNLTAAAVQSPNVSTMLILLFVAVLFGGLIVWHVRQAHLRYYKWDFVVYLLSRGVVWLFYIIYGVVCYKQATNNQLTFHLHHYFAAFLIGILAEFNHPISLTLLACASGIFAQGLAAYEAAPIFSARLPV